MEPRRYAIRTFQVHQMIETTRNASLRPAGARTGWIPAGSIDGADTSSSSPALHPGGGTDDKLYGLGHSEALEGGRRGEASGSARSWSRAASPRRIRTSCARRRPRRRRARHHRVHRSAELIEEARRTGPITEILAEAVADDHALPRRPCLPSARRYNAGSRSRSATANMRPSTSSRPCVEADQPALRGHRQRGRGLSRGRSRRSPARAGQPTSYAAISPPSPAVTRVRPAAVRGPPAAVAWRAGIRHVRTSPHPKDLRATPSRPWPRRRPCAASSTFPSKPARIGRSPPCTATTPRPLPRSLAADRSPSRTWPCRPT